MEQKQLMQSVRDKVARMISSLISAYQNAKSTQAERDVLLELRAVSVTLMLTDPVTSLGYFHEQNVLDVSRNELKELLVGYRANYPGPDEKMYLAKIQNCALRMQVLDFMGGERTFHEMLSELQENEQIKLVLM